MTSDNTSALIATQGLVLKTFIGSRVTGIHAGGDIDQMGIALEPHQTVTGLHQFESYQYRDAADGERSRPGDLDLTIYSLRKWARLAAQGNPTVLYPLMVPEDEVAVQTAVGTKLRSHAEKFVSKTAAPRFVGYMTSQMKGLRGEGGHTNRPELIEKFGYDAKFASHALRLGIEGIELAKTGRFTVPMPEPELSRLRAVRDGESSMVEVVLWAEELRAHLEEAWRASTLPDRPDIAWIDDTLYRAHLNYWEFGTK